MLAMEPAESAWDFAADYLDRPEPPHRLTSRAKDAVRLALVRVAENEEARLWLKQRQAPIVFVGHDDHAYSWFVRSSLPSGSAVILFGAQLLDRDGMEAAAVVAHELGHVWLRDHDKNLAQDAEEREADACASRWGFREALIRSLKSDLDAAKGRDKRMAGLRVRLDALEQPHLSST